MLGVGIPAAPSYPAVPVDKIPVQKPRAYQRAEDGSEIPVASSFVVERKRNRRSPSIRFGSRATIARIR